MTRLAMAQDHRTPIYGQPLGARPDPSGTRLPAKYDSNAASKLIAPLRKLKRALVRSAFPVQPSPHESLDDGSHLDTAKTEKATEKPDAALPAQFAGKSFIAFIGTNGASGAALDFITQEAAGRDTDFMEFPAIEDLFTFVENGNACDLALLDWDSLGHEALQHVRRRPAIAAQIAFIVMTNPTLAIQDNAEAPANAERIEQSTPGSTQRNDEGPERRHLQMLRYGSLSLDFRTDRAYWKDRLVDLTVTQFNIVHLLARHVGENLTYREIYDVVHKPGFHAGDGEDGYQTNVRSLIKRIRQRFHATDDKFAEIENHRGVGYRWRYAEEAEDAHAAPCDGESLPDDERRSERSHWSRFISTASKPGTGMEAPTDATLFVSDPLD